MTFVSPQTISRNSGYVYDENFVIYRTFVLGTHYALRTFVHKIMDAGY